MNTDSGAFALDNLKRENEQLREEVRVARRASDITAELVVQQFVKIEEILLRLEQKARTEQELGQQLADKLHEAESSQGELARDRERLEQMQIVAINMMEDITAAREAAEKATQAKSDFLANMSHEIRTPMTAILGYLDLLSDGCPHQCSFSTGEHEVHISTIQRNASHLMDIINGILDLSKIEAGKLELELIPCSPLNLIADVQSLMQVRSSQKGIGFAVTFTGQVPKEIATDPTRVKQVLINLVGNAIKFTGKGQVQLAVQYMPAIPGAPDASNGQLVFDVIDSGIGMSEEEVARLFEPFSQADSSTTRRFGGTGLGLTISKRLALLLGGDIEVTSTPGQGSTFRFTLAAGSLEDIELVEPSLSIGRQRERPPQSKKEESRLDSLRLLLAEDGPDNQRLIAAVLRRAGAQVTIAENGQVAIDLAVRASDAGKAFDVVLMDMQMPLKDGYTAARELRDLGYERPIVALTAHAMAHDRRRCIEAGCDDYASKPIDRVSLLKTIREHADRMQAGSQTQ